jgi:hypothetical protein
MPVHDRPTNAKINRLWQLSLLCISSISLYQFVGQVSVKQNLAGKFRQHTIGKLPSASPTQVSFKVIKD